MPNERRLPRSVDPTGRLQRSVDRTGRLPRSVDRAGRLPRSVHSYSMHIPFISYSIYSMHIPCIFHAYPTMYSMHIPYIFYHLFHAYSISFSIWMLVKKAVLPYGRITDTPATHQKGKLQVRDGSRRFRTLSREHLPWESPYYSTMLHAIP